MNYKKYIAATLFLSLSLSLPLQALAVDTLPPIPVSDSALRDKEVGITIFGFTVPGFSWDTLAIVITKKIIERVVDSTVKWINNGFEGNPAYVTDPRQYFSDLGDGIAGDFISASSSPINFLCSPFQVKVKLALLKSYNEAPAFQCTLTNTVANIEAFYDDFSQGGWDGWFAMTQNNANNPYGAFLEAKVELDSRIAKKLGLENQKLDWGRGFLSYQDCTAHELAGWNAQTNTPINGACVERGGPIKTPGSVIESQLEGVLGTGVRKLELADEFDELVGALLGQLLEKSIFSIKGLFSAPKVSENLRPGESIRMIDIDDDGIFDGSDTNGDGNIDICYFGGQGSDDAPPCIGSRSIDPGTHGYPTGPNPTTPGTPESEPASLLADVQEARAKYGEFLTTKAQYTEILTSVASKNSGQGWGVLSKTGGNRCPSSFGDISCDVLFHGPSCLIYDVLSGAGTEENPTDRATAQWFFAGLESRSRWRGEGGGGNATTPCVTVNRPGGTPTTPTPTPTPTPTTKTISATVIGNGVVSNNQSSVTCGPNATCSADVPTGLSIILTATPKSGETFTGWGGDCSIFGSNPQCSGTISANRSFIANFSNITSPTGPRLTLQVTGPGRVTDGVDVCSGDSTCNKNYATGTTVTLTITPSAGKVFDGWGGDCAIMGTAPSCSGDMSANRNVTATFR